MYFFEKRYTQCTMGYGERPRSWELGLLLTKLQKKIGEQDVLVAAPVILLGKQGSHAYV